MPILVAFFFIFTTVSVILSGYLLPRYMPTLCGKRFGMGLIFIGIAFAIWSGAVIVKPPAILYAWLTVGLLPLFVAMVYFILAGFSNRPRSIQFRAVVLVIAGCLLLLVLRYFFPSDPYFSSNGLFYFGQHPYPKFVTIALLCITLISSTLALSHEIRQQVSVASSDLFISICFTELVGSVLLLSNNEDEFLFFVGWAMGFGFLLMPLLFAGFFGKRSEIAAVSPRGNA